MHLVAGLQSIVCCNTIQSARESVYALKKKQPSQLNFTTQVKEANYCRVFQVTHLRNVNVLQSIVKLRIKQRLGVYTNTTKCLMLILSGTISFFLGNYSVFLFVQIIKSKCISFKDLSLPVPFITPCSVMYCPYKFHSILPFFFA